MNKKLIEQYEIVTDVSQKINLLKDLKKEINKANLDTTTRNRLKELLNEWKEDIHNYKTFQRQDLENENEVNIYYENNNPNFDNYDENSTP